jgi:predicted RNA-binding Zn ribbon-like protein
MGDQAARRMEPGTGVDMSRRPPALFVGDAPGLDFLNSIATPIDTPVDWIDDGEGLLSWLEQARLVPADALKGIRAQAVPGELDKVADQARSLREWFRGFVRQHKGRPLAADALLQLKPLNRLLERDETFSRISPQPEGGNGPFQLQTARRWRTPEAVLFPIGEALAQLVCTEDFSNIKACDGHPCTLFFADHTRGHARRWCSMAICGNRAKQAAHRHRAKAHRV